MIVDVDPKVDFAFQYMLGREPSCPLLAKVVDAVLNPPPDHRIAVVTLMTPFNSKEYVDDKLSILDIKARDQTGRQLNIEMQMGPQWFYLKRIIYYWSRFHQQQLQESQKYWQLNPTISISFLNHVLFPHVKDYHLAFHLREDVHVFSLSDDIAFHFIELPKFTKTIAELKTDLDFWLYFLRFAQKMDPEALPDALQHPLILQPLRELKMLSQTEIERARYEARRKWQMDYNSDIEGARLESLIETIQVCQRALRRPETPFEELVRMPIEELRSLKDRLKEELPKSS